MNSNRKNLSETLFVAKVFLLSISASFVGLLIGANWQHEGFTKFLYNWDGVFYRQIVSLGYSRKMVIIKGMMQPSQNAFFPTFPFLTRYSNTILPGNDVVAAIVINSIFAFATFFIFYKVLKNIFELKVARTALLVFALFPGTFILYRFYAESITLFFLVTAIYLLQQKRFLFASIFVAFATFSRPNALSFASMVPIYIFLSYLGETNHIKLKELFKVLLKAILHLAIGALGFISFLLLQWKLTGIKDVWFRIEREGWKESTAPFKVVFDNVSLLKHNPGNWKLILVNSFALLAVISILFCVYCALRNLRDSLFISIAIPSILVILLAISNNVAVASPRFVILGLGIFIGFAKVIPYKYFKYSPYLLYAYGVLTAILYTYPLYAA